MTRTILHIGTNKTGSTFLRSWLIGNRTRLLDQGIRTASQQVHFHRISVEAVVDPRLRAMSYMQEALAVPVDDVLEELLATPAAEHDEVTVISSEFYIDAPPREARRTLEDRGFSVEKIICFVRRQDRYAASKYNQLIKRVGVFEPYQGGYREEFDWDVLYRRWRDAFPDAELCFLGYDYLRERGLLLDAFKRCIGCPEALPGEYFPDKHRSNVSLDAELLEVVRLANERGLKSFPRLVSKSSATLSDGTAFGFDQQTVSEIESAYRPGNVLLANRIDTADIRQIAEPGWQAEGTSFLGVPPTHRIATLLGHFDILMDEAGLLPAQRGQKPTAEPFISLHDLTTQHSVSAGALLAAAERDQSVKEAVSRSGSEEAGNSAFPMDCALQVLDYASATLLRASKAETNPQLPRSRYNVRALLRRALFRLRHPLFDSRHYLSTHTDVLMAGADPYDHYTSHGREENRLASIWGSVRSPLPPFRILNGMKYLEPSSPFDREQPTVLVVLHEGTRTGAPIIGYNLILGLLKSYNVIALFLEGGPMANACRDAGALVAVAQRQCRSWSGAGYFIRTICDDHAIAFAIANSVGACFVLGGLKVAGIPTVSLIHEFASNIVPVSRFNDAVHLSGQTVFPARIVLENAVELMPELADLPLHVIPQGLCTLPPGNEGEALETVQEVRERMGLANASDGQVVIVGIATVTYRKGVDLFIQCAASMIRNDPHKDYRFVWVGGRYRPHDDGLYSVFVADQVRREGLEGRLRFAGEIHNMPAVYEAAHMMLLTSRLDPLPNVALEAMCHGLPLVCFDRTTGIVEFLTEAGLGVDCVAEYLDVESMARKAVRLVGSDGLRARVIEAARTAARAAFDADRYCAQIEQLALQTGTGEREANTMSDKNGARGTLRPLKWENDISLRADDTAPFENHRPISQWPREQLKVISSGEAPECIRHLPLLDMAAKDTLPIPCLGDREGHQLVSDELYWLAGLSDHFRVMQAIEQRGLQVDRLLDVGCASARVLRHFAVQSAVEEIWGADINHRHIRWLCDFMPKQVRPVAVPALPSLPLEDNYFDVVVAFSVFTHIDTFETAFLAEIRRVLKPGGLAYITVHDENTWGTLRDCLDNDGDMLVNGLNLSVPDLDKRARLPMAEGRTAYRWTQTGPYRCQVFHSHEYIENVWGRFFTIEKILPHHHDRQAVVLARK